MRDCRRRGVCVFVLCWCCHSVSEPHAATSHHWWRLCSVAVASVLRRGARRCGIVASVAGAVRGSSRHAACVHDPAPAIRERTAKLLLGRVALSPHTRGLAGLPCGPALLRRALERGARGLRRDVRRVAVVARLAAVERVPDLAGVASRRCRGRQRNHHARKLNSPRAARAASSVLRWQWRRASGRWRSRRIRHLEPEPGRAGGRRTVALDRAPRRCLRQPERATVGVPDSKSAGESRVRRSLVRCRARRCPRALRAQRRDGRRRGAASTKDDCPLERRAVTLSAELCVGLWDSA